MATTVRLPDPPEEYDRTYMERLVNHINLQFRALDPLGIQERLMLDSLTSEPPKIIDGLTVKADGTLWNPDGVNGEGPYMWWAGAWHFLGGGGAGGVCDCAGRHAIWITAGSMAPTVYNGCQPLEIVPAGGGPDWMTLNFYDTDPSYAQFNIRMPKSWNEGTITFAPVWSFNAENSDQTVCWALEAVATNDAELLSTGWGTAQLSIDTAASPERQYIGPESAAITVDNASEEGVVRFRIGRLTDNANDTSTEIALLHGLTIYITTDAVNDA